MSQDWRLPILCKLSGTNQKVKEDVWRETSYGRITGSDLERLLAVFEDIWKDRDSFVSLRDDQDSWWDSVNKLAEIPNWAPLYELDLPRLIAVLVAQSGISNEFLAAAKGGVGTLIDFSEQVPKGPPPNREVLPAAMAMLGNLEAISVYSRTINDMVKAAKEGDVEALGQALSVDAYLMCRPFFLAGLRVDQLSGQGDFTSYVMRWVSGPNRRRYEYASLRWAEYLLRDQGAFEACSREDIYVLLVHHLKLYDVAGTQDDAKSALFAMFKKWQKQAGIQNPRFGFSGKKKA